MLDRVDAQKLFVTGGAGKIYLNPPYAEPVYLLRKAARIAAKALNYAPLIVRNNRVICMRETRDHPLIPVSSEADLAALTLRPKA